MGIRVLDFVDGGLFIGIDCGGGIFRGSSRGNIGDYLGGHNIGYDIFRSKRPSLPGGKQVYKG